MSGLVDIPYFPPPVFTVTRWSKGNVIKTSIRNLVLFLCCTPGASVFIVNGACVFLELVDEVSSVLAVAVYVNERFTIINSP